MPNLTAEDSREISTIRASIAAYGGLRANAWPRIQLADIRNEVSDYDSRPLVVRFFWRIFTLSQIERKRAWVFYQESKIFLDALSTKSEVDAASCQNFVNAMSNQAQRLSFFSRLRNPAKQLLAFLQKLIPKLKSTVTMGSRVAAPAPLLTPSAATVLPRVELDFESDLRAFRRLCINPHSDKKEVKKEYFRLALKYHPDRAGAVSTERFKELKTCYDGYLDPLTSSENPEDQKWACEEKVTAENVFDKIRELEREIGENREAAFADIRADIRHLAQLFGITPEQLAGATRSVIAADSVAPPATLAR